MEDCNRHTKRTTSNHIVLLELLEGNAKAEKTVSELTATDINNENGMKLLIEKLDKVFESDKKDEAYLVYSPHFCWGD